MNALESRSQKLPVVRAARGRSETSYVHSMRGESGALEAIVRCDANWAPPGARRPKTPCATSRVRSLSGSHHRRRLGVLNRDLRETALPSVRGHPKPIPTGAMSRFRDSSDACCSIPGTLPTDRSLISIRGFDLPSLTCYKNPFCAVACPGPVLPPFPKRNRRETLIRRGQAQHSLFHVLQWKRVRNSGNALHPAPMPRRGGMRHVRTRCLVTC